MRGPLLFAAALGALALPALTLAACGGGDGHGFLLSRETYRVF